MLWRKGYVRVNKISTQETRANMMTKSFPLAEFDHYIYLLRWRVASDSLEECRRNGGTMMLKPMWRLLNVALHQSCNKGFVVVATDQ